MKKISAVAINALKEALTNIYWYKSELRSFLFNTISNNDILGQLNWEEYKRNIINSLINYLVKNQEIYQTDLLKLMTEVTFINDFSHLEKLEDGISKAQMAKKSVQALKKILTTHVETTREQDDIEKRRRKAYELLSKKKYFNDKLDELKKSMYFLVSNKDNQKKGFALEKIIQELFNLFDLDPKSSFKIVGEQIDGAFTFDNTDYLLEAKWQNDKVGTKELYAFAGKISRKLDNTLGLYLSINGFSEDAIKTLSSGRQMMILMDGSDLMAVLEGRIDLIDLLLRKRRHASQTGNIYLPVHKIFENIL